MNNLEAFVCLNMVGGIGSVHLKKLLDHFGSPQNILDASEQNLSAAAGIRNDIAQKLRGIKKDSLEKELKLARELGLKIITMDSSDYPENLKNISGAPILLYVKGDLKAEDKLCLAIVGSRRASFYGLDSAEKFAIHLSQAGFTVASGMARGVDTAAHKGALRANGRTIAVMGSGFGHIYPPENEDLAERICRNGAVISEFPVNAMPLRENFPRRNRIISGLSLGVLVVEAAQNSGALITADFALEQGRDVFALPGNIDSANSAGTNGLIKEGAQIVSCPEDIVEEFTSFTLPGDGAQNKKGGRSSGCSKLKSEDRDAVLYNMITDQPVSIDEIVERSNMGVSAVSEILLRLEMKNLIRQLPAKQFIRSAN